MSATILVTRPTHQADELSSALRAHHYRVIEHPTIVIERCDFDLPASVDYTLCIVTSVNAVIFAEKQLKELSQHEMRFAAIGASTAKALEDLGITVDIVPSRFNSERLLAMPALNAVAKKPVLLITGHGGRGLLDTVLAQRGAILRRIDVYKRICPNNALTESTLSQLDIILCTSGESLENLVKITPENLRSRLFNIKLLLTSERLLPLALAAGFKQKPIVADNATTQAILTACQQQMDEHYG